MRQRCGFLAVVGLTSTLVMLVVAGCGESGPQLGQVTGTVTVNGAPVKGLQISFEPQSEGAGGTSYGATQDDGSYKLLYPGGATGAVIGSHTVRIIAPEGEGGTTIAIPEEFGDDSTLVKEVQAGENTIDIDLTF